MEPERYEKLLESPDVFRDTELLEAVRVLRRVGSPHAARVWAAAAATPIEKPAGHRGGWNFVRVDLPQRVAAEVLEELLDAGAAQVGTGPAGEGPELDSLVARWSRYVAWLEAR